MKLLYIDCETAGLDPKKNPIIQISGIVEIDGEVKREFDYKVRPPSLLSPSAPAENHTNHHTQKHLPTIIDDKALEINKITREQLTDIDRLDYVEVYKKLKSVFLTYVDRYNREDKLWLVGQNVQFDFEFLQALWKCNSDDYLGSFIHHNKIDLISLTAALKIAKVLDTPNLKLATISPLFGVGEQTHDSLSDIKQTREIFKKVLRSLEKVKPQELFA